jgi:hypothetical protein
MWRDGDVAEGGDDMEWRCTCVLGGGKGLP